MFLDRFNEDKDVEIVDDSKYKSILDLELECIESEYDLNCIIESVIPIDESMTDKLNSIKEYIKKLWDKFINFIKKIKEYIKRKLYKIGLGVKKFEGKEIIVKTPFTLIIPNNKDIKFIKIQELLTSVEQLVLQTKNNQPVKDKVQKLAAEKLSSAIGIDINAFYNNNFDIERDIGVTKTKIETTEDLKKTEYYDYMTRKEFDTKITKYSKLYDDVNTQMTFGITAKLSNDNNAVLNQYSNPSDSNMYHMYAVVLNLLLQSYTIYFNIILKLIKLEIANYNKIESNCTIKETTDYK